MRRACKGKNGESETNMSGFAQNYSGFQSATGSRLGKQENMFPGQPGFHARMTSQMQGDTK
ncbi:hypothetical protein POPTR_003G080050v4 [Populus trichocarpa]|uniref:Uncharacterized protein n=1 Tax=Populus trichocarpa TaxID=3694 RepID=A0ACC0T8H4_POPTR|nr:hypothetical protein POPTR_003G080050v4 [Populus trichocarpa]